MRRAAARGGHDQPHHLRDYVDAVGADTGAVLKVHPSNFTVEGFTSAVPVAELARLGPPVVHDIGSGLLRPWPLLADEPDATTSLRDGAAVVTCSGDKLLGGPQAGLVLGRRDVVERMRRHPLARALRAGKTTLAALEATLRGPTPPAVAALELGAAALEKRCDAVAEHLRRAGLPAEVVPSLGRVGGGSAPALSLEGWAVTLPEAWAEPLRLGDPAVLARVQGGRTVLDLRALDPARMPCWWPPCEARPRPSTPRRDRRADVAVVATAGHVDHGKSALVRALTGTDLDRLVEERRRGMTGLARPRLGLSVAGRRVAIVDVPGHAPAGRTDPAGPGPVAGRSLVVATDELARADRGARRGGAGPGADRRRAGRDPLRPRRPRPRHGRRGGAAGGPRHPARGRGRRLGPHRRRARRRARLRWPTWPTWRPSGRLGRSGAPVVDRSFPVTAPARSSPARCPPGR